MPAIPKTSRQDVLFAARQLLEERGERGLTIQAVAERVGVKGPSLYKRFPDRASLLEALEVEAFLSIGQAVRTAGNSLEAIANAYLDFARANPGLYALLFSAGDAAAGPRAESVKPLLELLQNLLGDPQQALLRARVLVSFLHGYALMEASGAFRLGGDVSQVLPAGLAIIVPEAA